MFYYIKGKLALLDPNFAVIDAGGVGYKLTISATTHDSMPNYVSAPVAPEVKLYTYMAVREDGVELFGFGSSEELSAFKMLISVSGVGPKAAMAILSIFTPEKFALAVCTNDAKAISKANGVGAKTAARIILELHDKLVKETGYDENADKLYVEATAKSGSIGKGKLGEAQEALIVLGYSRSEVQKVLATIDPSEDLESIIKISLKKLMR